MTRRGLALAVVLASLPGRAGAQSPPDIGGAGATVSPSVAQAREAFRVGSALARQEQWVEALAAFERSAALHAHAVTTYNIAYCERALGHSTRARKMFAKALADSAPGAELPPALTTAARAYLVETERRLARVLVTMANPEATVAIDGRPLELEALGSRPQLVAGTREAGHAERPPAASFDLLVDPGAHMFVVAAAGTGEIVSSHTFTAGSTTGLVLGRPRAAKRSPQGPDRAAARAERAWATIAFGGAAAGLAAGAILGGSAMHQRTILDGVCPQRNACPPAFQGTIDAMNGYAIGSTVAFGVAIAGAGAGVTLLLLGGRRASAQSGSVAPGARAAISVAPWLSPGSAGLSGSF